MSPAKSGARKIQKLSCKRAEDGMFIRLPNATETRRRTKRPIAEARKSERARMKRGAKGIPRRSKSAPRHHTRRIAEARKSETAESDLSFWIDSALSPFRVSAM